MAANWHSGAMPFALSKRSVNGAGEADWNQPRAEPRSLANGICPVIVIRHVCFEDLGSFADVFDKRGLRFTSCRI